MSDILLGVRGLLRLSWQFLMHTFIPGTNIAFGVLFVGLCLIDLGFKFLSLVVGHSIGDISTLVGNTRSLSRGTSGVQEKIHASRRNDTV